ncbi:MAG TPA: hypothetical protein VFG86_02725, partial [Chloroflexota bacterium]|nr:hypothetical protein [Chloroflexota bacterium]
MAERDGAGSEEIDDVGNGGIGGLPGALRQTWVRDSKRLRAAAGLGRIDKEATNEAVECNLRRQAAERAQQGRVGQLAAVALESAATGTRAGDAQGVATDYQRQAAR